MRARFAKRRRKEALRKGLKYLDEGRTWSGYYVSGTYKSYYLVGVGVDKLRAFQLLLLDMKDVDNYETN